MAKKDYDNQIKKHFCKSQTTISEKHGKIVDNFVCLPNPENPYEWFFVVWGFENEYTGGYYMGQISCPDNYPAAAPHIQLNTENGRFWTKPTGICLSISSFHPESWNPAWKVNHIVLGLQTFWPTDEDTYGEFEHYSVPKNRTWEQFTTECAMKSREEVLADEKFQTIFAPYMDAMGIKKVQHLEKWNPILEIIEKEKKMKEEEEKKQAELKKINVEQKAQEEAEKLEREEKKRQRNVAKDFFKKLHQMGLTQHVGKPNMNKQVKNFFGKDNQSLI